MIAGVHFRNFKALRSTAVKLAPCNLVLGPNGSGKTSLIQAILRLRTLVALPVIHAREMQPTLNDGPQIEFTFHAPYEAVRVTLGCNADEMVCNLLIVDHPPEAAAAWAALRAALRTPRGYLFDHYAMAAPAKRGEGSELTSNGGNLAAVLDAWKQQEADAFAALQTEFCRLMPEFSALELRGGPAETVELGARLVAEGGHFVSADNLSQGTLYLLAILTLAFNPKPPAVVCLEEADRGIHPRMLRDVRDALYRLSYPHDLGLERAPVQVITTTHSPYLLDQFRDHPEEIILASKRGSSAHFERLADRADLKDLLGEAHLGDLWYSGILGAVPEDGTG